MVRDDGEAPGVPINVRIRGFLRFNDESVFSDSAASNQSESSQSNSDLIVDDKIAIYSVLFSESEIQTNIDGQARFTLIPRSDEILQGAATIAERLGLTNEDLEELGVGGGQQFLAETLVIEEGVSREAYDVVIEMTIIDDFYYGQTIEEVLNQDISDDSTTDIDGTVTTINSKR